MSRRPVQCNLTKCTFSDTPHRYHPGYKVPVRLELADDPDDLAVPGTSSLSLTAPRER